jgi:hypothetical protein
LTWISAFAAYCFYSLIYGGSRALWYLYPKTLFESAYDHDRDIEVSKNAGLASVVRRCARKSNRLPARRVGGIVFWYCLGYLVGVHADLEFLPEPRRHQRRGFPWREPSLMQPISLGYSARQPLIDLAIHPAVTRRAQGHALWELTGFLQSPKMDLRKGDALLGSQIVVTQNFHPVSPEYAPQ